MSWRLTAPAQLLAMHTIEHFEGRRHEVYTDVAGHLTVGVGHKVVPADGLVAGDRISDDRVDELLSRDVGTAVTHVDTHYAGPWELPEPCRAALISWTFNLGGGRLAGSTMLRRLNSGDWDNVPAQIRRWVYAGGSIQKGLVRRREAEAALFHWGYAMSPLWTSPD